MGRLISSLFTIAILLIVLTTGVGYFRGWFSVHRVDSNEDGNPEISITFDKQKIQKDRREFNDAAKDLGDKAKDLGDQAKDMVKDESKDGSESDADEDDAQGSSEETP
ncbi:MAG: hypothetical protein N2C14_32820 [Planctomycetales bacterium]